MRTTRTDTEYALCMQNNVRFDDKFVEVPVHAPGYSTFAGSTVRHSQVQLGLLIANAQNGEKIPRKCYTTSSNVCADSASVKLAAIKLMFGNRIISFSPGEYRTGTILRGTIVNGTCGIHENLYI